MTFTKLNTEPAMCPCHKEV